MIFSQKKDIHTGYPYKKEHEASQTLFPQKKRIPTLDILKKRARDGIRSPPYPLEYCKIKEVEHVIHVCIQTVYKNVSCFYIQFLDLLTATMIVTKLSQVVQLFLIFYFWGSFWFVSVILVMDLFGFANSDSMSGFGTIISEAL